MTTQDFIIALFYAVDQEMLDVPKHPDAKLYPSEVVPLALLFAIKGGGTRAFYRWLTRDYLPLLGIRLRRDNWVSVRYAEELNSTTSSVTLQRADRHGILGEKPPDFQVSV